MSLREKVNVSVMHLVIKQSENQMKYIPIIRKYTNLGVFEIKKRIENSSPILKYKLFDNDAEDKKVIKLINELISMGAEIKLYENELVKDQEISVKYLMNRFDRYKEVQSQNQRLDDLMLDEE